MSPEYDLGQHAAGTNGSFAYRCGTGFGGSSGAVYGGHTGPPGVDGLGEQFDGGAACRANIETRLLRGLLRDSFFNPCDAEISDEPSGGPVDDLAAARRRQILDGLPNA
jgi:hypothetical protein